MKILLSVRPEFAYRIFDGSKKYEFRRYLFKRTDINIVLVYASSPVQKVIGEFDIDYIITDEVNTLWEKTRTEAGISREYFNKYFLDKKKGHAIKIKNLRRYKKPLSLKKDLKINIAPQSFQYIN